MNMNPKKQSGVMLIEALVGMLIFLIGIIALMGMQAAALSNTTQAKYRSDAALFAGQIISQMWSDPANINSYNYSGGSSTNTNVAAWVASITNDLPGTSATTNPPVISAVANVTNGGFDITVTVKWQAPNETIAAPHNFTTTSRIAFN